MALEETAKATGNWDYLLDRPLVPQRVYEAYYNADCDSWFVLEGWKGKHNSARVYSKCASEQEAVGFANEMNGTGET